MKILNYGAGAVGLGIDSCLLKAGQMVDIIARPQTVLTLQELGLKRTGLFGPFQAPADSFRAFSSLESLSPASPTVYDLILVSTKSFDSALAAQDLYSHPRLWNPTTKIILFQNGWGNAEAFTQFFPKEQIYNARVITGFCRPNLHHVDITVHADAVLIGSLFHKNLDALQDLCQLIRQGGIPCQLSEDIVKDLWAKMLYNCALNSLGAIFDVPYGELGETKFTRNLMNTIIDEAFDVMTAAGYQTHWPTIQEYLDVFYNRLLPSTYQHRSSTLQDLKANKKTEIDAFNGVVVKLGDQRSIPTPTNRIVYHLVKYLEKKNRDIS